MLKTRFLKSFLFILLLSVFPLIIVNGTNNPPYEEIIINDCLFSTFFGGIGDDRIHKLVVDSEGNIIITGVTNSVDFHTVNALQENYNGSSDVFITKFSSDGQDILFSTFLGGNATDIAASIAIDSSGNILITGETRSINFPTLNPLQAEKDGYIDIFLTKISSTGALIFSTFLGGSGDETGRDISFDSYDNIILTGHTDSTDFPVTTGAYQETYGGGSNDAYITKILHDGQSLLYSTFLGGNSLDGGTQIEVHDDNIILSGVTASDNFNTTFNAVQRTLTGGVRDCFLTVVDTSLNDIIYSSLFGGNNDEIGYGLTLDLDSNIILTGYTGSSDLPTTSRAFQTTHNGNKDIFVLKINNQDYSLNFSTFLGGSSDEEANGIITDIYGNIFICGLSLSPNFPINSSALQTTRSGSFDFIISILDSTGNEILYSTFFGGNSNDFGYSIAFDQDSNLIVGGITYSSDFYVKNAIQDIKAGGSDGSISKLYIDYEVKTEQATFDIFSINFIFITIFIVLLRRKKGSSS